MNDEEKVKRGFGTAGTYFLLMPGPRWVRHHPFASFRDQYGASVVVKLIKDGTGVAIKNRYGPEDEIWNEDDMIMLALKAENR